MVKNIIKEMIIILLLALAIILILGVLLYDYVPANKIIPEKISYTTSEKVKNEIQTDSNVDDMEVVITDLNNYKKIHEYVPGKKNPFSSIIEESKNTNNAENNTNNNTTNSTNNNTTANETTGTSNENTGYLPDKGTK